MNGASVNDWSRLGLQNRVTVASRRHPQTTQSPWALSRHCRNNIAVPSGRNPPPDEVEELLQIYAPLAQNAPGDAFLLVRPASGDAAGLAASLRAAIARVDRSQVVSVREAKSLSDIADAATSRH